MIKATRPTMSRPHESPITRDSRIYQWLVTALDVGIVEIGPGKVGPDAMAHAS